VSAEQEIMLVSDHGTLVRTPVEGVSLLGRNTQGVRLITLGDGEKLMGMEPIADSAMGAASGEGDELPGDADESGGSGGDEGAADA
jgi:DNA gyrase subunit A